jgi:hypothetical protein
LIAALCSGGTCTVEVSSDHDCDDRDDPDCDFEAPGPPPPVCQVFDRARRRRAHRVVLGRGDAALTPAHGPHAAWVARPAS